MSNGNNGWSRRTLPWPFPRSAAWPANARSVIDSSVAYRITPSRSIWFDASLPAGYQLGDPEQRELRRALEAAAVPGLASDELVVWSARESIEWDGSSREIWYALLEGSAEFAWIEIAPELPADSILQMDGLALASFHARHRRPRPAGAAELRYRLHVLELVGGHVDLMFRMHVEAIDRKTSRSR